MTNSESSSPTAQHSFALNYWYLEEDQAIYNRDFIVSDSYVNLVINCGAPLLWEPKPGQQVPLPQAFVIGIHTQPLSIRATGRCQIIGIQSYAWSIRSFLSRSLSLRSGLIFEADIHWQVLAHSLRRTVDHHGYVEAIDSLRHYVNDIGKQYNTIPQAVQQAGTRLYANAGQQRITNLAASASLSLSQFERQFTQWTGVSPKTFARLVRCETVRDSLVRDPYININDLVYRFGYTDQVFLIF